VFSCEQLNRFFSICIIATVEPGAHFITRLKKNAQLQITEVRVDGAAQRLADIYKTRWSIELLFRRMKQHLQIRKAPYRNKNAIEIHFRFAYEKQEKRQRNPFGSKPVFFAASSGVRAINYLHHR